MIIDTHAHLIDEKYTNLDEIINNFEKDNLLKVFCVAYDFKSIKESVALAKKYKNVYAIIGFHPSEINSDFDKAMNFIRKNATDPKVIAIGEIGLDYHWDTTTKEEQKRTFIEQLKLANELKLPIVIHVRDALSDTLKLLTENKNLVNNGGVIHCFSGSPDDYDKFEKLGYMVSFGGVITFKNAGITLETVKHVPLSNILLETDCPYLTPVPFRGKEINQPKFTNLVAEKISILKNIPLGEVERITTENALRLFKKAKD